MRTYFLCHAEKNKKRVAIFLSRFKTWIDLINRFGKGPVRLLWHLETATRIVLLQLFDYRVIQQACGDVGSSQPHHTQLKVSER